MHIETLFNFLFLLHLESIFMSLYLYLCRSNKCYIELQKLGSFMETKENKVLYNDTTCWISMIQIQQEGFL